MKKLEDVMREIEEDEPARAQVQAKLRAAIQQCEVITKRHSSTDEDVRADVNMLAILVQDLAQMLLKRII